MSFLEGKKTYIVAFLGFLIVLFQAISDALNGKEMSLQLLFDATIALAMIFLRKGMSGLQTATAQNEKYSKKEAINP